MRSVAWWLCLVAVVAGLALAGGLTSVAAAEGDENGTQQEAMAPPPGPGPAPQMMMPPPRVPTVRIVLTPGMESVVWRGLRFLKCLMWVLLTVHVLLAVWVFLDIRKRGEGHGVFIALALLAGIPATILYALVRLGDMKKS